VDGQPRGYPRSLHLFFPAYNGDMTTQTIYTREEMIALTNESIKKGHRALENALKKDALKQHSYETSIL
jgi:hypothetical protein